MRILHILDHSLPLHSGYTFRTRAIMKAQAAAGMEVAALTGVRHGIAEGGAAGLPHEEEEVVEGLRFFRTRAVKPAPSPLAELREIDALAARAAEVAADFRPDIIHAHSPVLDALAARRVAKRLGIPLVYEVRAFWEDAAVGNGTGTERSPRYLATRWLETLACRQADAVAVICEGLRADLVGRGIDPAKILVSPNGVDLTLFGEPGSRDVALAAALDLPEGAEVIGFIGSLYDYEGVDDLVAAMPAILAERPDAHLLIVGGGPMAAALKAQAEQSPAAARIRFVGRVPHDEVERYYGLVDVLAYPRKAMRLTELVTPLKPLEAMAQRRLVAASDVGGHRELIDPEVTGTLFAPDDPAALADALVRLLGHRDDWERRREAGRAFVERERDWATNVSRYARLYRSLLRPAAETPAPDEADAAKIDGSAIVPESRRVAPIGIAEMGKTGRIALRRLSAAPLEAPLGVAVGGSLAFALFAMPGTLFDALVAGSGLRAFTVAADAPVAPGLRFVIVCVLALLAGAGTWALLLLAGGRRLKLPSWRVRDAAAGMLAVRRADAHPDAPPRAPILAARDLGESMMEVEVPALRASRAKPVRPVPTAEAADEAPLLLLHPLEVPAEDVLELTEIYDPELALETVPGAPPPPITALVARLQAGIARRAAAGVIGSPFDRADPALHAVLDSLGKLGARSA